MTRAVKPSTGKVFTAAALIIFGRLALIIGGFYGLTFLAFGWPPSSGTRLIVILSVAAAMVVVAAYLLGDFRTLLGITEQVIAAPGIIFGAGIGFQYFRRDPPALSLYEGLLAVVALLISFAAIMWLRRARRRLAIR